MWSAQRVAHALGAERAAAERDDARVGTREQVEHHLFLARAKGVLALAVEVALDRLAQEPLELAVGVPRLDTQLRGGRARGRRLAGAHEADEDESAGAGGRRPRRGQRFHPIRSRYAANAARTSSMWSPPNFSR